MTDYTKSTNFASKDSLAAGNPLKIVKGTEIDTEFNNIATAVATKANSADVTTSLALKADLASPALTGNPTAPTPTAGDNDTSIATTAFVSAITGTSGITALKNRLINAQGLVNQRAYTSGTATSGANQYTVDRWRVVTSGQNLTFSTTNNVVTFTAPVGGVEQVIEGLNLESGTYVLSWTGTATATVAGSSVTNGGTVTVVGGTNTTIKFSNGTFSLPQFEKGSTATSFDYRPYGTELALCERYCKTIINGSQSATAGGAIGYSYGTGGLFTDISSSTFRSVPSLTYSNLSHFTVENGVGAYTPSGIAISNRASNTVIAYETTGSLTAGTALLCRAQSASALLLATAEL